PRINHVFRPQLVVRLTHAAEMRPSCVEEELLHLRRPCVNLLTYRVLAVQDANGIGLDPLLAVVAKIGEMRPQIGLQRLAILRAAGLVAQRIEVHLEGNAEPAQPAVEQLDLLRIDPRARAAKSLDADLRELPVPPAL